MKKLKLNLDGVGIMLTKEEMKKVRGGENPQYQYCYFTYDGGFGCSNNSGRQLVPAPSDYTTNCDAQTWANDYCTSPCCSNPDCGCSS